MQKPFFVLLFLAVPALAVEPLPSATLLEQCGSSEAPGLQACRSYVHGFIGGAFASRTSKPVEAGSRGSYSERATRTRLSRGRVIYGQHYAAAYCLPSDVTLDDLIVKLRAHAAGLRQVPEHANQLVLGMLRKNYPCDQRSD